MLQKTNKRELNDGFYIQHVDNKKQKVYIDIVDDTIRIHKTKTYENLQLVDSIGEITSFTKEINNNFKQTITFNKTSFDIDFFTIPLKFRPNQNDVPAQLNTNLNAALYLGLRIDKFVLNYKTNPLHHSVRNMNHFGFSIGTFTGFGNTFMSPTNTNNLLQQEYDGVVWNKGLAGIFAINSFTLGLAIGFDNLLDKNNKIWIYESKPWVGLAFGLNLN